MTVGVRPDDLRRRNRAMAISAVRRLERPSRTDIAALTGLSHSTISAISADLIAEGIVEEGRAADATPARRGRPQVGLELNRRAAAVVTVVLRLNSIDAALVDYRGEMIREDHRRIETARMNSRAMIDETIAAIGRLSISDGPPVMRISVAVQGTTDAAARTMLWSPIAEAADAPLADALEAAFGAPVTVENDCNMMAEALRWRDPARYRDNFLALLLSDGIGMGLVLKGQLFTGVHSSGGEFGHMVLYPEGALCRCGRRGCIEAYAGNYAIWRKAQGHDETEKPEGDRGAADMAALAEAARAGDGPRLEAFRAAGAAVGFGLGSLFALIDAAPVAIVGTGAAAFDLIEAPMRAAIAGTAGGQHSQSISFATYPDELPLIRQGCAMRALTFIDAEIFAAGLASTRAAVA